ncbi:hypothetical protein D3C73_1239750 [compost metagenome]
MQARAIVVSEDAVKDVVVNIELRPFSHVSRRELILMVHLDQIVRLTLNRDSGANVCLDNLIASSISRLDQRRLLPTQFNTTFNQLLTLSEGGQLVLADRYVFRALTLQEADGFLRDTVVTHSPFSHVDSILSRTKATLWWAIDCFDTYAISKGLDVKHFLTGH